MRFVQLGSLLAALLLAEAEAPRINRFIAGQNLDTTEAIQFQLAIPIITSFDIVDPNEYGYDDEVGGGLPWP